jgi:hypothetical protein
MYHHSCKDYFDMHHELHIYFQSILVDKHNESHRYPLCNCLDSYMVEKHKDHLTKYIQQYVHKATAEYEIRTIFTSLTTISRRTLTSKSSDIVLNACCTIQARVISTRITYMHIHHFLFFSCSQSIRHLRVEQS